MSNILRFRIPVLVAYSLIRPFDAYFERTGHWHPLAALGLPVAIVVGLEALLPRWVYLSIAYTLAAATIVVVGGMYLASRTASLRNGDKPVTGQDRQTAAGDREEASSRRGDPGICPWCGSGFSYCDEVEIGEWAVHCDSPGCGARGPSGRTKAEAEALWLRRWGDS